MQYYCHSLLLALSLWVAVLFSVPGFVIASSITEFSSDIVVADDGSLHVTETIYYDFESDERHGIFRDIPRQKEATFGVSAVSYSDISVTNGAGAERPFEVIRSLDSVRVKIGDPDIFVTGEQVYEISYTADGALYFRDGLDEVYWNVTGDDWDVVIERARATVHLPGDVTPLQFACYRGERGSASSCARATTTDSNAIVFEENEILRPGTGLTVVVGFPKGVIPEPGIASVLWRYITAFSFTLIFLLLPFVALIGMGIWWYKNGRDPRGRGTIVTQFEPPEGLSAPEVGVIEDQYAKQREFTAGIIELAVKGFLRIHRIEQTQLWVFSSTDYVLERVSDNEPEDAFERELLNALFSSKFIGTHDGPDGQVEGVALSSLEKRFAKESKRLTKQLYKQVSEKGYFVSNPQTMRNIFLSVGITTAVLSGFAGSFFGNIIAVFSIIITGVIIAGFGFIMPARTKRGVGAREHIAGFERYVTVAEQDRLAFHNAPERTPERFDALLPYAIALGLEKDWAAIFADMNMEQPSWYHGGAHAGAFDVSAFSNELSQSFSSAVSSGAASGGGGSAGGGAGGGGGGSW